jgi:hypothetical protein
MEEKISICSVIKSFTKKYERSIQGRKINVEDLKGSDRIFSLNLDIYVFCGSYFRKNVS